MKPYVIVRDALVRVIHNELADDPRHGRRSGVGSGIFEFLFRQNLLDRLI